MVDLSARFEVVARHRPVRLVVPSVDGARLGGSQAPYVATQARRTGPGPVELALTSGITSVVATYDEDRVQLHVSIAGRTRTHLSRRHGRPVGEVEAVALTLTGPQATAFTLERGGWVARSRVDLTERDDAEDPYDPAFCAGLGASAAGPLDDVTSGGFGQLGLRDLRLVSEADGTAYRDPDGSVLLTATSAGPGWFPTGHASVWALDPDTLDLTHRADLFVRRGARVLGDHAVHLVRDRTPGHDRWLLAASTWGDFEATRRPVSVVLAHAGPDVDLTRGVHVLDGVPLPLPTEGLRSVGTWDPHLVHDGSRWLVGFVSATRYFRFHPALAVGADLDELSLLGADPRRRECEGTTVVSTGSSDDGRDGSSDGGWRVLASDRRSRTYPVLGLGPDLRELGSLSAAYPTNISWPTLIDLGDRGQLLVGFDGQAYAGGLVGYGSHGRVVVQRSR